MQIFLIVRKPPKAHSKIKDMTLILLIEQIFIEPLSLYTRYSFNAKDTALNKTGVCMLKASVLVEGKHK